MRNENLKGWLADVNKKEREKAAVEQETITEGTTAGHGGTGREGAEERMEKTPAEASNW